MKHDGTSETQIQPPDEEWLSSDRDHKIPIEIEECNTKLREVDIRTLVATTNEPTTNVATPVNYGSDYGDELDDYPTKNNQTEPAFCSIDTELRIEFKCHQFLSHTEIIGRILLFILNVLVLLLSTLYCMGQWYGSTLDLVIPCEGKSIEDIWAHSYDAGLMANGEVQMNEASQWGITSDPCFTTHKLSTNTKPLWYSNLYAPYPVDRPMNLESIAFALLIGCCFGIIVYNIYTLVHDFKHASRKTLHQTSKLYEYFIKHQTNTSNQKPMIDSRFQRIIRYLNALWSKYMANDTTGWVIRVIVSEIVEITIQTQALLLYNGYNVLDPHNKRDIYRANNSDFIVIFAAILAFNCVVSGILWCVYALVAKYCHGLLFKLVLFWVDLCSDLLYTMFPFIMILFDKYNLDKTNILVLLAQLNSQSSFIAFTSAFMPLLLLVSKSFFIIRSAKNKLAQKYYSHWKFIYDISKQKDDIQAVYQAKLTGWNINSVSLQSNNKELFGANAYISFARKNKTIKHWIQTDVDDKISRKKQCILIVVGLIYIIYGIVVLQFVLNHVNHAKEYCSLIDEINFFDDDTGLNINSTILTMQQHQLLTHNPELFFWNKCLYKVYPFTNGDKNSPYNEPCQCRVLVIEWDDILSSTQQRNTYFNLTQPIILSSMLTHWFQLEKFRTEGKADHLSTKITKQMFAAKHMKAFEWTIAPITCIEKGISGWKELEYFKLQEVTLPFGIPNDFEGLAAMKYLAFHHNGLNTLPDSICSLTNLEVLDIQMELNIKSIPKCIKNLIHLKQLTIENCLLLEQIPLSVFELPDLVILSLFHNQISSSSLIQYNAPSNIIDQNNTNVSVEWLRNALSIKSNIESLYLTMNPICDETVPWHPNITTVCHSPCKSAHDRNSEVDDQFCSPRLVGDGKCDDVCDNGSCQSDGGDCVQLCFSTDCTYELYTNDVCDEECNNVYCWEYHHNYNPFESPKIIDGSGPDLFHCVYSDDSMGIHANTTQTTLTNSVYNLSCEESSQTMRTYIDLKPEHNLDLTCRSQWVGDSLCDDICRTDECFQDGGDCESGSCTTTYCTIIHDAWLTLTAVPDGTHNVNISYFCGTIHPYAVAVFGVDLSEFRCDPEDKEYNYYNYDWNNDTHVNFREFTYLAYWFAGGSSSRGKQINCSECVGMEYYNIKYEDQANGETLTATEQPIDVCNSD
eukprot:89381_1